MWPRDGGLPCKGSRNSSRSSIGRDLQLWRYSPCQVLFRYGSGVFIFPTSERQLKDQLGEAISFGILNAMVCAPLFLLLEPARPIALYTLAVLTLVVLPAIWPFPVRWLMRALQKLDVILIPSHSAWDDVFLRDEPYFVIVHLNDGGRVGGYYGPNSFAGLHPISGHLYFEQLWYLDEDGKFTSAVPDSRGLILRPMTTNISSF